MVANRFAWLGEAKAGIDFLERTADTPRQIAAISARPIPLSWLSSEIEAAAPERIRAMKYEPPKMKMAPAPRYTLIVSPRNRIPSAAAKNTVVAPVALVLADPMCLVAARMRVRAAVMRRTPAIAI